MEHVSKKHSRLITEATGRCMDYWNAMCLAMRDVLSKDFAVYSDILLSRMRVMALRGARGTIHTDAFKGVSPNFFIPHDDHAKLRLWRFPEFRTSVVTLNGRLYIPMGYSEGGGLRMYGVEGSNPITLQTNAQKYLFPPEEVHNLQPVGRLPFVVSGMKQRRLQIARNSEPLTSFSDARDFELLSIAYAFRNAAEDPMKFPHKKTSILKGTGIAHQFWAWKFMHEYIGKPESERTHIYFRLVREAVSGSNYVGENFTAVKKGDDLLDSSNPGVFTSSEVSNFQLRIEDMVAI
jgi:hypothetical protein